MREQNDEFIQQFDKCTRQMENVQQEKRHESFLVI